MTTSQPLDQIDRNWDEGNCYYVTLQFMQDLEETREEGVIPMDAVVRLVHGSIGPNNKKIRHAWIEIDDHVLDHSNYQKINASVNDYYKDNLAIPARRFTRAEADALLGTLKTEDGRLPICYWGDLSDQSILDATRNYDEVNGVFVTNVCFSDPLDESNRDKLNINSRTEPEANPPTSATTQN